MIEALLVVICLLLLKITYQLIDIARAARHFQNGHAYSVNLETEFRKSVVADISAIKRILDK